ncbi:hypothetical protein ACOSQ4_018362 [Xanthoceras sorbifolium]
MNRKLVGNMLSQGKDSVLSISGREGVNLVELSSYSWRESRSRDVKVSVADLRIEADVDGIPWTLKDRE